MIDLSSVFGLPGWYKALTLSERAPAFRDGAEAVDLPRAERRLARWQAQTPFAGDGHFGRRLAAEGLTVAGLRALLGEPAEAVAARAASRPAWLAALERAFTAPRPLAFPLSPEILPGSRQIGLLELVRPLLDSAWERLNAGLEELAGRCPEPLFEPAATAAMLARSVPSPLLLTLGRAAVSELHRAAGDGLLGGDTPEERFQSFVSRLRRPEVALDLLLQFPVLARQLVETVTAWQETSLEMLGHLTADAGRLRAAFSPDRPLGRVCAVQAGLGDAHRGGRSVATLEFDSGLRLVYKPRPVAVEAAFQQLLDWVSARGFAPALRGLRVVDAGDHGWVEHVAAAPCADEAALERFYLRQGGYLALLWVLSATDMHHENLIAAGEHPVPVDLEALFHPSDETLGRAREALAVPDTPLRVGLLPNPDWGNRPDAEEEGIDLSALAATDGQVMPRPVLQVEDSGTDRMRFVRRPIPIPGGQHRPTLAGAEVPLKSYIGTIVQGFERMLRLLAAQGDELLTTAGPLAAFACAPVRVLVRPTMIYATLFNEGQHPYFLGDALDRDRLFDRLWAAVPEAPAIERLIPAEHRDLTRGDIPLFTTRPSSRDLWASDGERIPEFFATSGLDRVRERLRGLDGEAIERQIWIARNSLETFAGNEALPEPYGTLQSTAPPAREELLAVALAAGERLEALAFRAGEAAFWFGPRSRGTRWAFGPAGLDLHLGIPGIVLFLAHLGALTGEERFTALARAGLTTVRGEINDSEATALFGTLGAFSGWGGVIYTLTHLAVLWQDESLVDDAERIAGGLEPRIIEDVLFDVVAGVAGCLVPLLGLYTLRRSNRLLDLAVLCGERLLAGAFPQERGAGWIIPSAPRPLAGFSHGAAGISWSLLKLADATGDARFRRAALDGLDYERWLFSPAERNWPDLRPGAAPAGGTHFQSNWCHGAAGILLGRLDSLRFIDDDVTRAEIADAVETTLASSFGDNHCLCHGDLGNLEPLTLAAEVLDDPVLAARCGGLAGGILASLREHGYCFGMNGRAEVPGLMLGIAGIGYGLLRLAAPDRVPAVLRLAPPPGSQHSGAG